MKEAYLPLREIRQKMNALSSEEVRQRLEIQSTFEIATEETNPSLQPVTESGTRAMDYISHLLDRQLDLRSPTELSQPLPLAPSSAAAPKSIPDRQQGVKGGFSEGESWRRIVLMPGVELNVRDPLDASRVQIVQGLVGYAQKLIQKYQKGG